MRSRGWCCGRSLCASGDPRTGWAEPISGATDRQEASYIAVGPSFAIVPPKGYRRVNACRTMRWLELTAKAVSRQRQWFRTAVSESVPTPGRHGLSDGTPGRAMIPIRAGWTESAGVGSGPKAADSNRTNPPATGRNRHDDERTGASVKRRACFAASPNPASIPSRRTADARTAPHSTTTVHARHPGASGGPRHCAPSTSGRPGIGCYRAKNISVRT